MNNSKVKRPQQNQESRAVIGIINDAIIFTRISCKMYDILNIFEPKNGEHEFELEHNYSGINNAFDIMKVKDEKLEIILGSIYWDLVLTGHCIDDKADELAKNVYSQWIEAIKKYNSTYNWPV